MLHDGHLSVRLTHTSLNGHKLFIKAIQTGHKNKNNLTKAD